MRNREPFSLFVPLNVWNLFLAIFSTMGAFKLSYDFFETILTHGLQSREFLNQYVICLRVKLTSIWKLY